jgi:uncharacterized membrane protein
MSRRRSRWGTIVAGAVVIAGGFGVAVVEALKLPNGSIWVVVAAALVLVLLIRRATR